MIHIYVTCDEILLSVTALSTRRDEFVEELEDMPDVHLPVLRVCLSCLVPHQRGYFRSAGENSMTFQAKAIR